MSKNYVDGSKKGHFTKILFACVLIALFFNCFKVSSNTDLIYNTRIQDYQSDSCENIFQNKELLRITNITYWIRMLDCAENSSSADNRARAKQFNSGIWPDVFVWMILVSNANPNNNERKKILHLIEAHEVNIPNNMRSLVKLIKEEQLLQVALFTLKEDELSKSESLTEEVKRLNEINSKLESQLTDTQNKLNNLADIERQLSVRRQMQNQIDSSIVYDDNNNPTPKNIIKPSVQSYHFEDTSNMMIFKLVNEERINNIDSIYPYSSNFLNKYANVVSEMNENKQNNKSVQSSFLNILKLYNIDPPSMLSSKKLK